MEIFVITRLINIVCFDFCPYHSTVHQPKPNIFFFSSTLYLFSPSLSSSFFPFIFSPPHIFFLSFLLSILHFIFLPHSCKYKFSSLSQFPYQCHLAQHQRCTGRLSPPPHLLQQWAIDMGWELNFFVKTNCRRIIIWAKMHFLPGMTETGLVWYLRRDKIGGCSCIGINNFAKSILSMPQDSVHVPEGCCLMYDVFFFCHQERKKGRVSGNIC